MSFGLLSWNECSCLDLEMKVRNWNFMALKFVVNICVTEIHEVLMASVEKVTEHV
jgi:hypothetical protein